MKCLYRILVLTLLTLTAWGCAPASKPDVDVVLPAGTLNAAEVTALFSDKTVESVVVGSGRVSTTYYDPNGQVRQLQNGQQRVGTWQVREDGRMCLDMEDGGDKCRIIVKEGDTYRKYIVKLSGKHQHVIDYRSFRNGNPLGL